MEQWLDNKQLFSYIVLSYRLKSGNKVSKKNIKTTDIVVLGFEAVS